MNIVAVLLICGWMLVPDFRVIVWGLWTPAMTPGATLRFRLGRGALCLLFAAGFPLLTGYAALMAVAVVAGTFSLVTLPLRIAFELIS